MRGELNTRLLRAIEKAPEAIGRWAAQEPGSYRRLMPGPVAFLRNPGMVGYEHRCGDCGGVGKLTCAACGGACNVPCFGCHGQGRINCYSCHGNKKLSCPGCSGRGSWTEYITSQVWNSQTNSYVSDTRSEYRTCTSCSGSGHQSCYSCEYDGKIRCSGCFGNGRIDCAACGATGRVNCPACLASGVRHMWGHIEAAVETAESLSVATNDKALEHLVRTRIPVSALPAHGELLNVLNDVHGHRLTTRHRLRLDVRRACIEAQGRDFVIHGFGPEPRVLSFENIAGHLLEGDLAALEAKLATARRWDPRGGVDLLDATADFLRSELNMLVAERVADLKATPQEAAAAVEQHFHSMVTADYAQRATTVLRDALARLYGAEVARSALYVCLAAAAAAGVLFGLAWPGPGMVSAVTWGFMGAGLAWVALEWRTRRRIGSRFESGFAARVLGQLRANGSFKRWRWGMAAAAVGSVYLGVTLTQQLPFVQSHHAQQRELARAASVLAGWRQQPAADFRQRSFPPNAWLKQQAAAGDTQAQLVLAWQLLLGASGVAKDIDAAGPWLDRAEPRASQDPLWKAAKALHAVNQEAMPDVIRAAADDLGRAADQGLVEARFWQARLHLADNSPLFDARRGVQLLQQAADAQHARAAHLLGERYAKGEGVRRDVGAARRYLMQAAGSGLVEAGEALQRLK